MLTRYDYNLMIMKSPKPATDTIYPHIKGRNGRIVVKGGGQYKVVQLKQSICFL
jgi:hypothetical protein